MLGQKQIVEIREALQSSKNPLFFFDDDPDGLCSFLLLYRLVREGHGVIVKGRPSLDALFLKKVEEYHPDRIFIVDVPVVEQEFIDKAKVEVIWIDHHNPVDRRNVRYFNPRINDIHDSACITRVCYEVAKQDMWIAALGSIADWQIPEWFEDFRKQ
ncbi:hypothetical protein HYU13_06485, partial [Candidatus Woesearchaeota archaeon]|nr:hypothetical protein [Candidatus Woesearchaeota archaeon]